MLKLIQYNSGRRCVKQQHLLITDAFAQREQEERERDQAKQQMQEELTTTLETLRIELQVCGVFFVVFFKGCCCINRKWTWTLKPFLGCFFVFIILIRTGHGEILDPDLQVCVSVCVS